MSVFETLQKRVAAGNKQRQTSVAFKRNPDTGKVDLLVFAANFETYEDAYAFAKQHLDQRVEEIRIRKEYV